MNDISAILAKIDADARQYAQAAQAAAEQKAEAIREDYRRQAEEEAARAAGEAQRQAEAIRQRAVSQAGIEARNSRLAARREAIDSAFQRAMERLCAMPEEEKIDFYAGLGAQSLAGDAALVLNRAEMDSLGERAAAELEKRARAAGKPWRVTLAGEPGAFRGGFVLDQGVTEINCTFEVLCAGVKEELEAQVASVLFP